MPIRFPVAVAALAALSLAGCTEDDSVYSSGGDPKVRRQAQQVVLRNLTARARGNGRAYCSTYTPRFLKTYHETFQKCTEGWRRKPGAPRPRIRFTGFGTATDEKVVVSYREPGSSEQSAYLEYTAPSPEVGTGKRWLIDLETVRQED